VSKKRKFRRVTETVEGGSAAAGRPLLGDGGC
jgi:hypothetical protein